MADCIDEIIAAEGNASVTNDPDDSGGLTKFGISAVSHPHLDILSLTREQARAIYEDEYLKKPGIDQIEPAFLRDNVLDFAVNCGIPVAIRTLQLLLGVERDGQIGPDTLAAIAATDAKVLNNKLCAARESYYFSLAQAHPKNRKFLRGWRARARKFYIE